MRSATQRAIASGSTMDLLLIAKIANYRFDDLVADANPITSARFNRQPDFS